MEITFNVQGNIKQKEAVKAWLDPNIIDIAYGGSKGSAKSFTGCNLIFGDALIYPNTHYFIARKKLNDLRKYTIPSIHEVFNIWGVDERYYKYNGQDNYFQLHNDSKVFLLDAKYLPSDPTYARFGSMQMTRGWIEEAGEFELEAKNNLQASIGRWKNNVYDLPAKLLQTCNPAKNYLYADYYKPFKDGTLDPWKKFIQALPTDNKKLPKGYIDNLYKILSPNEIERLIKGNWEYDDDPLVLMDYGKILEMFTNEFVPAVLPTYLTADIAYEGSDIFVIGIWYGMVLEHIIAFDKVDETQVAKKIVDLRIKYNVPLGNVIFDADGLRTFVKQSVKVGNLQGAVAFHNNGKALYDENYFNLKAQCYFKLADMVQKNQIFVRDKQYRKQIIEEAEQIKKMHRDDDKQPLRIEKKDDLKQRLGRSPDFIEMIMLRMYFELKPQKTQSSGWASAFR